MSRNSLWKRVVSRACKVGEIWLILLYLFNLGVAIVDFIPLFMTVYDRFGHLVKLSLTEMILSLTIKFIFLLC